MYKCLYYIIIRIYKYVITFYKELGTCEYYLLLQEPLLLIDKSSLCGGSRFPFSLSEWSLTICLTQYNRR